MVSNGVGTTVRGHLGPACIWAQYTGTKVREHLGPICIWAQQWYESTSSLGPNLHLGPMVSNGVVLQYEGTWAQPALGPNALVLKYESTWAQPALGPNAVVLKYESTWAQSAFGPNGVQWS